MPQEYEVFFIVNKAIPENGKYFLAGIFIVLLLAGTFIYKSGGVNPALEKLAPGNSATNGVNTPEENKIKLQNEIVDKAIAQLKSEGKNKDRILVNAGGGIGGGGESGACTMQATKIGDSNYFVRVKVTSQQSAIDQTSGQTLTYTYADVDEYEKITGTTVQIDNETGSVITTANLSEQEYLEGRASIPDLNPEKLLIVAAQEPGTPEVNAFTNFYLTYDNNVFSASC